LEREEESHMREKKKATNSGFRQVLPATGLYFSFLKFRSEYLPSSLPTISAYQTIQSREITSYSRAISTKADFPKKQLTQSRQESFKNNFRR
jgi:hypothetical protein